MEDKKKVTEQAEDTNETPADAEAVEINPDQLDQVSGAGRPKQHLPPH